MSVIAPSAPEFVAPEPLRDPVAFHRATDGRQVLAVVIASISGAAAIATAVVGLIVLAH